MSPTLWLSIGVIFMALEAFGLPGIGLFFAGLGALTVGSAIGLGLISEDATITHFLIFSVTTAASAALLWKPMQKFRSAKSAGYNNMVGETAYVGSNGLSKQKGGEVTWSGTIMKAKLTTDSNAESLEAGAPVTILEITGNVLIVKPI